MHIASLLTNDGLQLFLGDKAYTISRTHPRFDAVFEAVGNQQYERLEALLDVSTTLRKFVHKLWGTHVFSAADGLVLLDGEAFGAAVSEKALRMLESGLDVTGLLNFLVKVRENPSFVAQEELLLFCIANKFAIHTDGDIIAFKRVRADYTDTYTGKVDNHVGQAPNMPRHQVDDQRANTCSRGLHFATLEYAQGYGSEGPIMVMKVNPGDVVSIPNESGDQKGRCCRYEVIAELAGVVEDKEVYATQDFVDDDLDLCPDCGRHESNCVCDDDLCRNCGRHEC